MSDIADWLAGASERPAAAQPSRFRECHYPGCHSAVLRGSQEIATWREVVDASVPGGRRVLLCPEHAALWDQYLDARYRGETDGPVLHH